MEPNHTSRLRRGLAAAAEPTDATLRAWVSASLRQCGLPEGATVADLGCGTSPYRSVIEPHGRYVGIDGPWNPGADVVGLAEAIPLADASFDAVVCTQVLEHVADPDKAVREVWRILKPGGWMLASTHGIYTYHPHPEDHWRWTHTGLTRLVLRCGDWDAYGIRPQMGSLETLGFVNGLFLSFLMRRAQGMQLPADAAHAALRLAGRGADRLISRGRSFAPGAFHHNYLVCARRLQEGRRALGPEDLGAMASGPGGG